MANITANGSIISVNVSSTPNTITVTETDSNILLANVNTAITSVSVSTTQNQIDVAPTTVISNATIRSALSVNDTGGMGSLTYTTATGLFTYTGASNAEVRNAISNTAPIFYNSTTGVISFDPAFEQYANANVDAFLSNPSASKSAEYYVNKLNVDGNLVLHTGNTTQQSTLIVVDRSNYSPGLANAHIKWDEGTDKWKVKNGADPEFTIADSTTNLVEGTNLYFTTARANSAITDFMETFAFDPLNINTRNGASSPSLTPEILLANASSNASFTAYMTFNDRGGVASTPNGKTLATLRYNPSPSDANYSVDVETETAQFYFGQGGIYLNERDSLRHDYDFYGLGNYSNAYGIGKQTHAYNLAHFKKGFTNAIIFGNAALNYAETGANNMVIGQDNQVTGRNLVIFSDDTGGLSSTTEGKLKIGQQQGTPSPDRTYANWTNIREVVDTLADFDITGDIIHSGKTTLTAGSAGSKFQVDGGLTNTNDSNIVAIQPEFVSANVYTSEVHLGHLYLGQLPSGTSGEFTSTIKAHTTNTNDPVIRYVSGSTNKWQVSHDGTTFFNLADGDITEVVAGNGLTGGGTVGAVTLDVGAGYGIQLGADDIAISNSAVIDQANIAIPQYFADAANGPFSFNGNLTVAGNLNYENVTDLYVTDQKITLNANATTDATVEIIANRPVAGANTVIRWNEAADVWQFTNDGTTYYPIPTSTTDLAEGDNLYYTTDRANAAIGAYQGNINTSGNITADYFIATTEFVGDLEGAISENAYNNTASTLTKGSAVYISGAQGDKPNVALANAENAAHMPAMGIIKEDITASSEGQVVISGVMNYASHEFTIGASLWVNGAGVLQETRPTSEANLIQKIAKVIGPNHILVQGAGRSNETPNLDDGNIFVGNTSNQAVTADLSNFTYEINSSANIETSTNLKGSTLYANTITTNGNDPVILQSADFRVDNQNFEILNDAAKGKLISRDAADNSGGPDFDMQKARGGFGSEEGVVPGDNMFNFLTRGYHTIGGGFYRPSSLMGFVVDPIYEKNMNYTNGVTPYTVPGEFRITPDWNLANNPEFRIRNDGSVRIENTGKLYADDPVLHGIVTVGNGAENKFDAVGDIELKIARADNSANATMGVAGWVHSSTYGNNVLVEFWNTYSGDLPDGTAMTFGNTVSVASELGNITTVGTTFYSKNLGQGGTGLTMYEVYTNIGLTTAAQWSDFGATIPQDDISHAYGGNVEYAVTPSTAITNRNYRFLLAQASEDLVLSTNGVNAVTFHSNANMSTNAIDATRYDGKLRNTPHTLTSSGNISGAVSFDVTNGSIFKATVDGDITSLSLTNAESGHKVTIILTQGSPTGTLSAGSNWLWAGGNRTLSNVTGKIDVIEATYDGTYYYATLNTDFSTDESGNIDWDGGNASTSSFEFSADGGNASTTSFASAVEGGNAAGNSITAGGFAGTTVFGSTVDGGSASTASFDTTIDGGNA